MAYALKTTGIATALTFCLAVDEDGVTIKEFVSADVNSNMSVSGSCTVGSQNWKGVSRHYFATGGSGFSPSGISFPSGHRGTGASDADIAYFIAFAGSGTGSGNNGGRKIVETATGGVNIGTDSVTNKVRVDVSSATVITSSGAHPTDNATPWALGLNYADSGIVGYNTNGVALYYGLESGSIASDNTAAAQARGDNPDTISYIGGQAGNGTWAPKVHIICQFNRQLTGTEFTSLHTDWFGTLFDSSGAVTVPRMLTLGAG